MKMPTRSYRISRSIGRLLLGLAIATPHAVACLAAEPEKVILAGSWSGTGLVAFGSGDRERARCHAEYVARSETTYLMTGTCSIASGNVSQTAVLKKTGPNTFSGRFHNTQYDVAGSVRVLVHGRNQSAVLTSSSGSASLTLKR